MVTFSCTSPRCSKLVGSSQPNSPLMATAEYQNTLCSKHRNIKGCQRNCDLERKLLEPKILGRHNIYTTTSTMIWQKIPKHQAKWLSQLGCFTTHDSYPALDSLNPIRTLALAFPWDLSMMVSGQHLHGEHIGKRTVPMYRCLLIFG